MNEALAGRAGVGVVWLIVGEEVAKEEDPVLAGGFVEDGMFGSIPRSCTDQLSINDNGKLKATLRIIPN